MRKGVYDLWVTPWVAMVPKGRRLEYQVLVADVRSGIYTSHGTHMGLILYKWIKYYAKINRTTNSR